ncbi:hypothetical protein LRS40_19730 [Leclercia sp. G3L]|uniref:hypothetical protein n=1 Tax=Leclercia sp. G3L TaxID=2898725 RepID=UPI001E4295A9|nr:hypothetical protein [Leclercia sp. G3L]UGB01863.1 hypothetical protein LRS40_19730 [Leclercia sp. G3L]
MPKLAISLLLYLACFYAVGYSAGYITGGITWHTLYMLERIITVALLAFIPVFIFAVLIKAPKEQRIIKSLSAAAINIIPSAIALLVGFTDAVTRGLLTYFLG